MEKLKLKENQKLLIGGVLLFIAMLAIVGYTYSFFQVEDKDTETITGTVASVSLSIEVNKLAPDITEKGLVPQLDAAIEAAVVGRNSKNCVDDNNNTVCQVYEAVVTNNSSVAIQVDGLLELNTGSNPNLKWAIIDSYSDGMTTKPNLVGEIKTHEETAITTNETYNANQTKRYYIVVWISETTFVQADTGVFTGTITFKDHEEEDKALATMLRLGYEDYYGGRAEDFPGFFNSYCTYNNQAVLSATSTTAGELCETIYKVSNQNGDELYVDGLLAYAAIFEGKGTWDSTNSACLYEGNVVFDFNQTPISSEENCRDVYNLKPYVGQDFYVSMIDLLEGEKGIFTGTGLYSVEDDLGTSYFFKGDVENNWVKFGKWSSSATSTYVDAMGSEYVTLADCQENGVSSSCKLSSKAGKDMYWRIIRINGDGTIRMILDATNVSEEDPYLVSYGFRLKFNEYSNDNTYVGYMYGTPSVTASGVDGYNQTHSNMHDSVVKNYLENTWYKDHIKDTKYEKYIADAIYCNDRSLYSGTGIGTSDTIYAAHNREENITPTLKCSQVNDRFTLNDSIDGVLGNGKLNEPVGLITVDELLMIGRFNGNRTYLTLREISTMSPGSYGENSTLYSEDAVAEILADCSVNSWFVFSPVISLKADALQYSATSNGTKVYPFVVSQ